MLSTIHKLFSGKQTTAEKSEEVELFSMHRK